MTAIADATAGFADTSAATTATTLSELTADLPPPKRTVPALLKRSAEKFGNAPLLSINGLTWSHRDAATAVAGRAGALKMANIERGDKVAIMCGNKIELLETFLANGWIGAASVPINTASMGPQIQYFLTNSEAKLLVIDSEYLDRLDSVNLSATKLELIWIVASAPDGMLAAERNLQGVHCTAFPPGAPPVDPIEALPGETLAVLYTSGTTGPAKGVTCPHAQYFWWGAHSVDALGITQNDVLCTTLPLFHTNALHTFAQACLSGASVVYQKRFSASGFWPSMNDCGATVAYLLGAMAPILLAQPVTPAERSHRVRLVLGPGIPAGAAEAFYDRTGVTIIEGFGSTETNFAIATTAQTPPRGIMGWVRPGFEARVVDENDVQLPDGQAGELVLRADEPFAFATGYLGMPEKTVEAWRNLWFHTGDRVVREADGAFRFLDRIKDAIRRRGENISSYEVEAVLLGHPSIEAAAVYPVKSKLAEDEVMASLTAKTGRSIDLEELASYCQKHLPYFAVPRYIDVVKDLPRTANGKTQKFVLREQGITATTWDRLPESDSNKRNNKG